MRALHPTYASSCTTYPLHMHNALHEQARPQPTSVIECLYIYLFIYYYYY